MSLAEQFAAEFERRFSDDVQGRKHVGRWASNRASGIDDRCDRRIYLYRTAGERQAPPSDALQSIFGEGKEVHEPAVIRRLDALGWRLRREQAEYRWDKFNLTGHIEGWIEVEHEGRQRDLPIEIKSISGNVFARVSSEADLRDASGGASYLRKWYGQAQAYMLLMAQSEMVLLVKDKQTGWIKPIVLRLDYEYAEGLLTRLERVNEAVESGTPPPFLQDAEECRRCSFYGRACNPPIDSGEGAEIVTDEHLLDAAKVWKETRAAAERFEEASETLKVALRGKPLALVGDLVARTIEGTTTKYEIPKDVKAQYAQKVPRLTVKLEEVHGG